MRPPAGVVMQVQMGRDDLLPPSTKTLDLMSFDIPVNVDFESNTPNFLGKFAQGPKTARFIYVNSGTYAGQTDTCWSRRAKISLMGITPEQIQEILSSPGSRLEVDIEGTGSDGGPVCGSIRSVGERWKR